MPSSVMTATDVLNVDTNPDAVEVAQDSKTDEKI